MTTIIEQLAHFTADCDYAGLETEVVDESKRIILDSIGCAFAALDEPKGKIGLEIGRMMGGATGEATILGTGERGSVFGAAFANGELINALDYDAILPPGHVTPYVLPGALAVGESRQASGKELIAAVALSHEMSNRLGKAMDYLRDMKDGEMDTPKVYGYVSTIFGGAAAAAKLLGLSREAIANALGIAGSISPVNSHMAWVQHAPSTTIKYTVAGVMAQNALTAAFMGKLGHRGDKMMLDDAEYGYPRLVGSRRWEKDRITEGLGQSWRFVKESHFKAYPHCHVLTCLMDALRDVQAREDIRPDEIEAIKIYVEAFIEKPIWLNNRIEHVQDAQFSIAHGIALAAQRVPPGKEWQDPKLVFSPAVMALMEKVTHEIHPDYTKRLAEHPSARPARVEIKARGKTFVGEKLYPKGMRSPDPASFMTTDELVAKFRHNAEGVIAPGAVDALIDDLLSLEKFDDIGPLLRRCAPGAPVARLKARASA